MIDKQPNQIKQLDVKTPTHQHEIGNASEDLLLQVANYLANEGLEIFEPNDILSISLASKTLYSNIFALPRKDSYELLYFKCLINQDNTYIENKAFVKKFEKYQKLAMGSNDPEKMEIRPNFLKIVESIKPFFAIITAHANQWLEQLNQYTLSHHTHWPNNQNEIEEVAIIEAKNQIKYHYHLKDTTIAYISAARVWMNQFRNFALEKPLNQWTRKEFDVLDQLFDNIGLYQRSIQPLFMTFHRGVELKGPLVREIYPERGTVIVNLNGLRDMDTVVASAAQNLITTIKNIEECLEAAVNPDQTHRLLPSAYSC